MVLGRIIRIAIALPLLALSCWVLLPFAVVPVSMVAVTNARIARVRTMATGQVLRFHADVGDRVETGQKLIELVSVSPGSRNAVEDLLKKKSEADIQYTASKAAIAETEKRLGDYDKELREYTNRTIAETEMRLRQASRALDSAKASAQRPAETAKTPKSEELVELDHEIARLETTLIGLREQYKENHPDLRSINSQLTAAKRSRAALVAQTQTAGGPAETPSRSEEQLAAAKEVETRTTAVERLRTQLSNLQAGYFVGPEMDRPPVTGQRDDAAGELSRLREQKLVVELRQRALSEELAKMNANSGEVTAVKSSVDGIVWSRDVPSGQTVREGEDLLRIAETGSIQVEAYVDSRYAQRLSIGDRALIYLRSVNKHLSGRLTSIQAPGQRKADSDNYAIDLKPPVEGQYRVLVQLDPADRTAVRVGQVAKVLFPGPDSSLMAQIYSWLSRF